MTDAERETLMADFWLDIIKNSKAAVDKIVDDMWFTPTTRTVNSSVWTRFAHGDA